MQEVDDREQDQEEPVAEFSGAALMASGEMPARRKNASAPTHIDRAGTRDVEQDALRVSLRLREREG